MRRKRAETGRALQGQVVTEYAMVLILMAGILAHLWIFYEGFAGLNLYGNGDAALGLEKVVSAPFP